MMSPRVTAVSWVDRDDAACHPYVWRVRVRVLRRERVGQVRVDREVVALEHIDGDSTNNRLETLRLVCPNCDSQLPTFKARNRGKGRAWRRQRYADGKSY